MDLLPSSSGTNKGKSKAKHVGFSDDVEITRLPSPPEPDESDLTDLTEVENSINKLKPSPRRLRSKGSVSRLTHDKPRLDDSHETARRITPMRKAKGRVGNLNESTDEEVEEDELVSDAQEDEEVDELQDLPSSDATPKPKANATGRRTPVRSRLRARHLQTHTPPSDGDDEGSEGEGTVVAGEEGDDEGSDEDPEEEAEPVEPRRLRNGKIIADEDEEEDIGEEDEEDEEEEEEQDEEDEEANDSESVTSTVDGEGADVEGEEDEVMNDDDGTSAPYVVSIVADPPLLSRPHRRHSEDARPSTQG